MREIQQVNPSLARAQHIGMPIGLFQLILPEQSLPPGLYRPLCLKSVGNFAGPYLGHPLSANYNWDAHYARDLTTKSLASMHTQF